MQSIRNGVAGSLARYFESDSIPQHTRLAILNARGDAD